MSMSLKVGQEVPVPSVTGLSGLGCTKLGEEIGGRSKDSAVDDDVGVRWETWDPEVPRECTGRVRG